MVNKEVLFMEIGVVLIGMAMLVFIFWSVIIHYRTQKRLRALESKDKGK